MLYIQLKEISGTPDKYDNCYAHWLAVRNCYNCRLYNCRFVVLNSYDCREAMTIINVWKKFPTITSVTTVGMPFVTVVIVTSAGKLFVTVATVG